MSRFRVGVLRGDGGLRVERRGLGMPAFCALCAVVVAVAMVYTSPPFELAIWGCGMTFLAAGGAFILLGDWRPAPSPGERVAARAVQDVKGYRGAGVHEWRKVPRSAQGPFLDVFASEKAEKAAERNRAKKARQAQASTDQRRADEVFSQKAEGRKQL